MQFSSAFFQISLYIFCSSAWKSPVSEIRVTSVGRIASCACIPAVTLSPHLTYLSPHFSRIYYPFFPNILLIIHAYITDYSIFMKDVYNTVQYIYYGHYAHMQYIQISLLLYICTVNILEIKTNATMERSFWTVILY